jgi:hypothetical protein
MVVPEKLNCTVTPPLETDHVQPDVAVTFHVPLNTAKVPVAPEIVIRQTVQVVVQALQPV